MSVYQESVGLGQAIGVPGAFASANPIVSTPLGCIAEENVQIGGFVWLGTEQGLVKSKAVTEEKPLGFVVRIWENTLYDTKEMSSDMIPAGNNVGVQVKGDFYAVSATAAVAGEKVFAVLADGTIKTGAAGGVITGAVETDWTVALGGDVDTVIIISNY